MFKDTCGNYGCVVARNVPSENMCTVAVSRGGDTTIGGGVGCVAGIVVGGTITIRGSLIITADPPGNVQNCPVAVIW